jgi:hypothetical protein
LRLRSAAGGIFAAKGAKRSALSGNMHTYIQKSRVGFRSKIYIGIQWHYADD